MMRLQASPKQSMSIDEHEQGLLNEMLHGTTDPSREGTLQKRRSYNLFVSSQLEFIAGLQFLPTTIMM